MTTDMKVKRFFQDLGQWDLSLKTGIPQSRISLIERGYVHPREDEKEKIATALKCIPDDIFPPKREAAR